MFTEVRWFLWARSSSDQQPCGVSHIVLCIIITDLCLQMLFLWLFFLKKLWYIYCSSLFNRLYGIVDPSNRRTFLHLHIWTIYVSQVVDRIALRKGQKPFQNCIYDIFRTWYNKQNIKENRDDVPWHEELYWYHIVLSTDRLILYFC